MLGQCRTVHARVMNYAAGPGTAGPAAAFGLFLATYIHTPCHLSADLPPSSQHGLGKSGPSAITYFLTPPPPTGTFPPASSTAWA